MKLFRNFTTVLFMMIVSTGVVFYTETIIGRALSPELYGDYRVVMTIVVLLGQLLLFGLDFIIVKQIPKLLQQKRTPHAKYLVINIFRIIVYTLLVWEVFAILINQTAHNLMFDRFLSQNMHPAYFYLACAGIFAFFTLLVKTIKALGHNILSTILNNTGTWLKLAFVLIIPITLNTAILSSVITKLIIICIAIPVVISFFSKVRASKFVFPPSVFKDAFNYTAQQLFAFRVPSILLIIMEALPIGESKIGIFSAAVMIANLALVIVGVIQNIFLVPIISAMHNERLLLQKLLSKIYIIATVSILFASMVLYFFTPVILKLYGIHFASVIELIPLALIAGIPVAVTSGDILFVSYFNSHTNKILTYLTILKSIFAIILGIFFIKFFDIYGAMTAYIAIESISALGVMYLKHITIAGTRENKSDFI